MTRALILAMCSIWIYWSLFILFVIWQRVQKAFNIQDQDQA